MANQKDAELSLEKGLNKTKTAFFTRLNKLVRGKSKVDDAFLDTLEDTLLGCDIGIKTTIKIINLLEKRVSNDKYLTENDLNQFLCEEILNLLPASSPVAQTYENTPLVILVIGVNGVGKTTTIAKLANKYKLEGKSVFLGAGDTFRAAAVDQLQVWADRIGCKIIKQQPGSDPASVAYDAIKSAKANHADVVIIDTAGRLHNKVHLMNELVKIKSAVGKVIPKAPHEILLVLDATTGQNAFEQAKQFSVATEITGMVVTKLDGTAKGGVVIGISDQIQVPVKYVGLGEGLDDFQIFDKELFVKTMLGMDA